MNDYKLTEYCEEMAEGIWQETQDLTKGARLGAAYDQANVRVDGSEHVTYYSKAHSLCQNCKTDNGEQGMEECGLPEEITYNKIACLIAYHEILHRVQTALYALHRENEDK